MIGKAHVLIIFKFFCETVEGKIDMVYEIDGTIIDEKALHPVAIIATNAQAFSKRKIEKKLNCFGIHH